MTELPASSFDLVTEEMLKAARLAVLQKGKPLPDSVYRSIYLAMDRVMTSPKLEPTWEEWEFIENYYIARSELAKLYGIPLTVQACNARVAAIQEMLTTVKGISDA